jgi:DUF4097 and DUF4098 domain-containing protein YvlB
MTRPAPVARVLGLLLLCGGILASIDARAQHARTVNRTIEVRPDGRVELSARAGSVRVTTWDRPAVDVALQIDGGSAARVADVRIQVERDAGHVKIRTNKDDPDGPGLLDLIGVGSADGPSMNDTLRIPKTASLRVATTSAAVDVSGVEGNVTVEGLSAPIRVRDIGGRVVAGTFSGSLRAEAVRGELVFGTFSGGVHLQTASLPAKSQIGSFSGSAKVLLPADAAFNLRAETSWGGTVASDFALPDSAEGADGEVAVGGGGPTITFESFNGDLTLRAE